MKKILSFLLSVTIIFSNAATVSAFENNDNCSDVHNSKSEVEEVDFEAFATGISDLINEYDNSIDCDISDYSELKYGGYDTFVTASSDNESTNRLIVKSEHAIDTLDAIGYVNGYDDLHILQFEDYDDCLSAYEYYSSLDCVEYVQEDGVLHESEITEEYFTESAVNYPTQYQSDYFGYSSAKRNMASGKVTVAVVDSGVANDHEMLVGRVVPTGFDSINNTSCYDTRGHGTHVAGIIVANTKSNVTIRPYKVLNNAGAGTDAQVYLGIQAAIEDNVDIINLSLTKKGDSEILREVITEAYNQGITVICAAGNSNENIGTTTYTPSSFPEVISAVAIDTTRYKSDTSNWGSSKDLSAPGVNILSSHLNNTYRVMSGTSMAAPFIVAAASYLLAKDNTLTPDEVFNKLYASTTRGGGSHNIRFVCPGSLVRGTESCSAPVITPASGTFVGYAMVNITCSQADAEILYRTSDMASKTWLSYTEPITIDETTTISAYCIRAGYLDSDEVTAKYTEKTSDSSIFEVNENGVLTGYSGTDTVVTIPEICNGRAITGIGAAAFSGNEDITSVTLGNNITTIENGAFAGCTDLQSVTAPSVTAIYENTFDGCVNLQTLDASAVTTIFKSSLKDCVSLSYVNLKSLKQLPAEMFMNHTELKTLALNALEIIDEKAFYGCTGISILSLPAVTIVESDAFYGCTGITSISLPKVVSIGNNAFYGCTSLKNLNVPNLVTIGDSAFKDSTIKSITLSKVTNIGVEAFYNTPITSVSLGNDAVIGASAFENCKSLTTVEMSAVTTLGERVFAGCTALTTAKFPQLRVIPAYAFYNCECLSTVTWVNTYLKSVGDYAFYNCKSLESVSFYNQHNIEYFGESSFRNCTALQSVSFVSSFETLNAWAFAGCTNLTSITLPSTLININNGAFSDCKSLTSIIIPSSVTSIGDEAFLNCTGLLYVFYPSTKDNWYTIDKGLSNTSLTKAHIHYSANDHSYTVTERVSATCAKDGYEIKTCSQCGYSYTTVLTEPHTGRTYTVKPTCTEEGYTYYKCDDCDYTSIKSTTPATGHSYKATTVAPTCTEDGYEGNECTVCGNKDVITVIPATGHSYSTEWTVDVPAGCGNEGTKSRHCTVCDAKTDITVIPAVSEHVYSGAWLIDYNATCTEDGLKYRECPCGQGMETMIIPATGHSFPKGWQISSNATCTKDGMKRRSCSNCDEEEIVSIPATGHDYPDVWYTFEPTCTEDGYRCKICANCGDELSETLTAPGHDYPDECTIVKATCTVNGSRSKTCANCYDVISETILAPGHSYSEQWTIDEEATCTNNGSKSHHCIICDDKADVIVIKATGHNYLLQSEDNNHPHTMSYTCYKCKSPKVETPYLNDCIYCNYTVTVTESGDFKLLSYVGNQTEAVVPATYLESSVKTIANGCFKGNDTIKSVVIADGLTSIGALAFMNCMSLEKVVIPATVTSIGAQAFYGFTGTIYCSKNSTAHQYALNNNIKFILDGATESEKPVQDTIDTKIDYDNFVIRTNACSVKDVTDILGLSESAVAVAEASYIYGDTEFYGTGTTITVFDGNKYIGEFLLVVNGDINGDSVCDSLDASQVALASNGLKSLDDAYALAADSNSDDIVDINDYQAVVNKVVA